MHYCNFNYLYDFYNFVKIYLYQSKSKFYQRDEFYNEWRKIFGSIFKEENVEMIRLFCLI